MNPVLLGNLFCDPTSPVRIDQQLLKRLITEGCEAFPYEYTALLAGGGQTILAHFPAPLGETTHRSFHWSGPALLTTLRRIEQAGLVWLGVLHTHPTTAALPSPADVDGWHYPTLGYFILSLADATPDLVMYQWIDGQFHRRAYEGGK